tara:strand:- start:227 stop:643 length:417 start_codon:yes stop_codon:yes gene_type:complete
VYLIIKLFLKVKDYFLKNVLGTTLKLCSKSPLTGYLRDGFCRTDQRDKGLHLVAAVMTKKFLDFTKSRGNDLSTPNKAFGFPGLIPGDRWCLCALRWMEAYEANCAPPIVLEATNERALDIVDLKFLLEKSHSHDHKS